jgi:hypothetical protein
LYLSRQPHVVDDLGSVSVVVEQAERFAKIVARLRDAAPVSVTLFAFLGVNEPVLTVFVELVDRRVGAESGALLGRSFACVSMVPAATPVERAAGAIAEGAVLPGSGRSAELDEFSLFI